ncbi:MAG: nicotinate-nucleotide diphosphorylase (carboxylating), partial [Mucinivorans sp.]
MKAEYRKYVDALIELAIAEDLGDGDHTSLCSIPTQEQGRMKLLVKQDGILAGVEIAKIVFERLDSQVIFEEILSDGHHVKVG